MSQTDLGDRIRAVESVVNRLDDVIVRFGNRAFGMIGIDVAMLGFLAVMTKYSANNPGEVILFLLSFIFLGISIYLGIGGIYHSIRGQMKSFNFFDGRSEMNETEFKVSFKEYSSEDYLGDLLEYYYKFSKILNEKFEYLQLSVLFLIFAIIPWTIALYFR